MPCLCPRLATIRTYLAPRGHKLPIGLVRDFRTESAVWGEVDNQRLLQQINEPNSHGRTTISDISLHYIKNELPARAPSTAYLHRHVIHDFLIPRWGKNVAVSIKPLDLEKWLKALHGELGYANPSCAKIRQVMVCVYKHAQRHGLIPRTEDANPMKWVRCKTTSEYEAIILTPEQAFHLVSGFPPLERTITMLAAATGLRISECLGLPWQDLDFAHEQIHVRRTRLGGQIGQTRPGRADSPLRWTHCWPTSCESGKIKPFTQIQETGSFHHKGCMVESRVLVRLWRSSTFVLRQ